MIPDSRIWHIYPTNDLREHLCTSWQSAIGLHCNCVCEPDICEEDNGYFIVHNSFDGREGVEWVNEIISSE